MKRIIICAAVFLIGSASMGHATIYSYFDDSGQEWFVDREAAIPAKYRDQRKTIRTSDFNSPQEVEKVEGTASPQPLKGERDRSRRGKSIEIFVTDWCPYCKKLESFLKTKGIPYKRYDIEKDDKGYERYLKLGGRGVPVVKVGESVFRGFDPNGILAAYEKLQEAK